jgi:hypothetical protein
MSLVILRDIGALVQGNRAWRSCLFAALALMEPLGQADALAGGSTADGITVELETRIQVQDSGHEPSVFTRLAWSPVTNQIAISAFAVPSRHIVDPTTRQSVELKTNLPGSRVDDLSWSRKMPWLVVANGTRVQVFDTSRTNGDPAKLLHAIDNAVPAPLVSEGASVVDVGDDEWIVLAGQTNRKLNAANPELAAHSLATGDRKLAWQFPSDGSSYYFHRPTAQALNGEVLVASWVNHFEPSRSRDQGSNVSRSSWEIWLVSLRVNRTNCVIKPLQDLPQTRHTTTEGPALSPDGRWLAFATGWHNFVHVIDAAACALERKLPIKDGPMPVYLAFSPNGRWLLGTSPADRGTEQGRIRLWRTSDWKLVQDKVERAPFQASFNKDSTRFAVATTSGAYVYRINER